jgi:hypothetical protein
MPLAVRTKRRRRARDGGRVEAPTIREICLVGRPAPSPEWAVGEDVEWAGRPYRVAAIGGGSEREEHGPWCYVHLRPEESSALL